MYPALHEEVAVLLADDQLNFQFHGKDDDSCLKHDSTNLTGRFICRKKACASSGWSSGVIPVTIRLYSERSYNARVYFQRCKQCNSLAKPKLDKTYAERVSRRLKIWSGVEVPTVNYQEKQTERPHEEDLCEGCKVGRCPWGKAFNYY